MEEKLESLMSKSFLCQGCKAHNVNAACEAHENVNTPRETSSVMKVSSNGQTIGNPCGVSYENIPADHSMAHMISAGSPPSGLPFYHQEKMIPLYSSPLEALIPMNDVKSSTLPMAQEVQKPSSPPLVAQEVQKPLIARALPKPIPQGEERLYPVLTPDPECVMICANCNCNEIKVHVCDGSEKCMNCGCSQKISIKKKTSREDNILVWKLVNKITNKRTNVMDVKKNLELLQND